MTPNLFVLNTNTILTISFFRSFKKCKNNIFGGIYIYVTQTICCQEQKMGGIICPSHITQYEIIWQIFGSLNLAFSFLLSNIFSYLLIKILLVKIGNPEMINNAPIETICMYFQVNGYYLKILLIFGLGSHK